ncbi:MAG: restriction endonuclease [Phycisphaerales bacterium]|nr:MAG: restriction endonuclease [Phycisphaerales bacterium]
MRKIRCRNCGHLMDLPDYHGPTHIVCPKCDWHEALPARRHLKARLEHKAGIAFGTLHEMVLAAAEAIEKFRQLPAADFEEFCAELFAESVYAVTPVDQAIHTSHALELKKGDEITLVACRRGGAEHRVQREDLENLAGAMRHHGAVGGIFLTTGSFTDDSLAYAEEAGIELIDADELQERIAKLEASVVQKWCR